MLAPWKTSYDQSRQHIKKQRHYFANKGPSNQGYVFFSSSHVWMWELDYKESWELKNWCFKLWFWRRLREVLGWQGDPTSPSKRKSVLKIHWKDWYWSWNSKTLATWFIELTQERPCYWKKLKVGGEEDDRGWDGWMTSLIWWTWVWVSSRSWWGQGSLAFCSPWDHKETDMSEWLKWTELITLSKDIKKQVKY